MVFASTCASAQESFGRLFHTPAQRTQLDAARTRPPRVELPPEVQVEAPAAPQSLSIDGIVRRSDGRATVWVNRKPTEVPERRGPVRVDAVRDAADGADLRLPDTGQRVRIKVGQEVDVQSGTVTERYRQPRAAGGRTTAGTVGGQADGAPAVAPSPGAREGTREGAAEAPAGTADSARTPPVRDAAIERVLRELGRRLDEPVRETGSPP
jgi:hypothetical protein